MAFTSSVHAAAGLCNGAGRVGVTGHEDIFSRAVSFLFMLCSSDDGLCMLLFEALTLCASDEPRLLVLLVKRVVRARKYYCCSTSISQENIIVLLLPRRLFH